jgi:hypothetical protein
MVVMALWVLSPDGAGGAIGAWRGVGLIWLGAHQVPLLVAGRELTLLPLGAVVPALLILRRAGLWAARIVPASSGAESLAIVVSGATLYGAGGVGLAWLTASPTTAAQPLQAGAVVGAVGLIGFAWGVGSEAGWVGQLRTWCGEALWRIWSAGLVAVIGLLAVGGLFVSLALVVQFRDVTATLDSLHAGAAGGFGLTVLGILALPTMMIWAMAILVGAPVSFDGSGSLGVHGGALAELPALPALACLPASIPSWMVWGMVAPVLLGVLGGRIRWRRDLPTVTGVLASAAGLAVVVAALVAVAVGLASGSLGGQRMAQIGPALPATVGGAAGLVALGFLLEAAWQAATLSWSLHRGEVASAASGQSTSVVDITDPIDPGQNEVLPR